MNRGSVVIINANGCKRYKIYTSSAFWENQSNVHIGRTQPV